jgi:hypothetical protein
MERSIVSNLMGLGKLNALLLLCMMGGGARAQVTYLDERPASTITDECPRLCGVYHRCVHTRGGVALADGAISVSEAVHEESVPGNEGNGEPERKSSHVFVLKFEIHPTLSGLSQQIFVGQRLLGRQYGGHEKEKSDQDFKEAKWSCQKGHLVQEVSKYERIGRELWNRVYRQDASLDKSGRLKVVLSSSAVNISTAGNVINDVSATPQRDEIVCDPHAHAADDEDRGLISDCGPFGP